MATLNDEMQNAGRSAYSGPKTYRGKSTKLGYGGRAAQLKDALTKKGLPSQEIGGIIGNRARAAGAAPGQKNYHGGKK